ncbi:DUF885 domain-containing protein [Pseudaquidulcibacter saccharophilus]|uniref:DUF885 domain-containing protein n=1 Tax=Pseudaquidulcibacter saccharophilus TaxID=2831900 RepID=UPI001EFF23BC|nr:DUF885 domain-containing protein [Pseudaquidulcibacter saccharophilus]
MIISRRALNFGLGSILALPLFANAAESDNVIDNLFGETAKDWLEDMLKSSPVSATQIGKHDYDEMVDDLGIQAIQGSAQKAKTFLAKLEKINRKALSKPVAIDYNLLVNSLKSQIWNIETLKEWEWNPLYYQNVIGSAIYNLMARDFAPIRLRLLAAGERMKKSPALFAAVRANIKPAKVPTPYAITYSAQNKGLKSIIDEMIIPELKNLAPSEQEELKAIIAKYNQEVDAHQKWIDETLVPVAKGDFRVGAKVFDKQLKFVLQSNLTREDIKQKALDRIKYVRGQMFEIAKNYYEGAIPATPDEDTIQKVIQNAINKAAEARPERNALVETATAMTEVARKFVIEKDLITLPDGPVKVILMPEFQRGYAVAYCDSPGPLDKNLPTFYAVSPIPDDWSKEQADSFLKEYSLRGIQDIAVHEAMPGHYVQIFHANTYPSILRAILSSGSFVEGWAVYAENMMVEQGFKADDPLYKLVQLKVQLRTITNALIDQKIHCEGMTEDEMMKLLTETAFQEESEARGKWRRAQLSYTQLSTYFVGFMEHLDARAAYEKKMGKNFDLKKYHDGILAFGSPPMKYAKASLLG